MNKNKKIAMLFLIIASLIGALLLTNCAADLQGKSSSGELIKLEFIDYGKANSFTKSIDTDGSGAIDGTESKVENEIIEVPGDVTSFQFRPRANISAKIEVKSDVGAKIDYTGNLIWKVNIIEPAMKNKFSVTITSEDGNSKNIYYFKVTMARKFKSFKVLANNYLVKDFTGVIGDDSAKDTTVNYLDTITAKPTIRVDLSNDAISSSLQTSLKNVLCQFEYTGTKVIANGVEQKSGITTVDFSNGPVKYSVYGTDGSYYDYYVYVGVENTSIFTDEQIMRKCAVIRDSDKKIIATYIIAQVDNDSTNLYIAGDRSFRKNQLGDNTVYLNDEAAVTAGGVMMSKTVGMFRGKYLRIYSLNKPTNSSDYKMNVVVSTTASPTIASDIYKGGVVFPSKQMPYLRSDISIFSTESYISLDFEIEPADYIIVPSMFVRGQMLSLGFWSCYSRALLFDATTDPDKNYSVYTGAKYSLMRTMSIKAESNLDYLETDTDTLRAGQWDWKIGEGVVGSDAWNFPSFHFSYNGVNIEVNGDWVYTQTGEQKPNFGTNFVEGKYYTFYFRNMLYFDKDSVETGKGAQIKLIESDQPIE